MLIVWRQLMTNSSMSAPAHLLDHCALRDGPPPVHLHHRQQPRGNLCHELTRLVAIAAPAHRQQSACDMLWSLQSKSG